MTEVEITQLIALGKAPELAGLPLQTVGNQIHINRKAAIRVEQIDCSTLTAIDLDIYDDTLTAIGVLCFTRQFDDVDFAVLSDWQQVAYLTEVPVALYGQPYSFQADYTVIESQYVHDYLNSMADGSPVWGGFSHKKPSDAFQRKCNELVARRSLKLPTAFHSEGLVHSVLSSHCYDRFLKLYHQFELLFDFVAVRRIQMLGDDLQGVAQVMSSYASGDLPGLKSLLQCYCADPSDLWDCMRVVRNFEVVANQVFQVYGKGGNPLDEPAWRKWIAFANQGVLSQGNAKLAGLKTSEPELNRSVVDIAAYWIFRVRCCIAHSRIGEYVFTGAEQDFVVEFAEPLLKEALSQVLSNRKLPI
jgi:hypothetical protein